MHETPRVGVGYADAVPRKVSSIVHLHQLQMENKHTALNQQKKWRNINLLTKSENTTAIYL